MNRILWNRRPTDDSDPGDVDEIVITNPTAVHIEQMDDNVYWIQIDLADGTYWAGNFAARVAAVVLGQQENAGVIWDRDDSHEIAVDNDGETQKPKKGNPT